MHPGLETVRNGLGNGCGGCWGPPRRVQKVEMREGVNHGQAGRVSKLEQAAPMDAGRRLLTARSGHAPPSPPLAPLDRWVFLGKPWP